MTTPPPPGSGPQNDPTPVTVSMAELENLLDSFRATAHDLWSYSMYVAGLLPDPLTLDPALDEHLADMFESFEAASDYAEAAQKRVRALRQDGHLTLPAHGPLPPPVHAVTDPRTSPPPQRRTPTATGAARQLAQKQPTSEPDGRAAVLALLAERGPAGARRAELIQAAGQATSTVAKLLAELRDTGAITVAGSTRATRYYLPQHAPDP